jgi:N6-L-threonylcarbamoyladenine synthase
VPSKTDAPVVLGIESSCDETGVGIVRGFELLADQVASSMEQHARFGGVIPEIASRAHLEAFVPTLAAALETAGVTLGQVDAVAATAGPGLMGCLTVGLSAAKALALKLGKPLYGVNHIAAHGIVDELVDGELPGRLMALIVSGGHSSLLLVEGTHVEEVGRTLDDAAGECFDKVGRVLGLPYPGGPHIDKLGQKGDPKAIRFPRGLTRRQDLEKHPYDFSFSGVKTAVARWVEAREDAGEPVPLEDVAASLAEAVADVLCSKTLAAMRATGTTTLVVGGGFSANSELRAKIQDVIGGAGMDVRIPPIRYCTDNGAMCAAAGYYALRHGLPPSSLDIPADSGMPLTQLVA